MTLMKIRTVSCHDFSDKLLAPLFVPSIGMGAAIRQLSIWKSNIQSTNETKDAVKHRTEVWELRYLVLPRQRSHILISNQELYSDLNGRTSRKCEQSNILSPHTIPACGAWCKIIGAYTIKKTVSSSECIHPETHRKPKRQTQLRQHFTRTCRRLLKTAFVYFKVFYLSKHRGAQYHSTI